MNNNNNNNNDNNHNNNNNNANSEDVLTASSRQSRVFPLAQVRKSGPARL